MTDGMRSGLRHRLRRAQRHIEAQHRHLGPIQRELHRAMEEGSPAGILEWLARYTEALLAHFDLEEGTVFPAIQGSLGSVAEEISALVREHEDFRGRLSDFRSRLEEGRSAAADLDAFGRALRHHESREEALLAAVVERFTGS